MGMAERGADMPYTDDHIDRRAERTAGLSLRCLDAGVQSTGPDAGWQSERQGGWLFCVMISGRLQIRIGSRHLRVDPGMAFILRPDQQARFSSENLGPWNYCYVVFDGADAGRLVSELGFTELIQTIGVHHPIHYLSLISQLREVRGTELSAELRREAGLRALFASLLQEHETQTLQSTQEHELTSYVDDAIRFIQEHYAERLRIGDLADRIGISRNYLTKLMQKRLGLSTQEYLMVVRMEHAAQMLSSTDAPVREIAVECGYEDPFAFSKLFKSRYGESPSQYRRERYRAQSNQSES